MSVILIDSDSDECSETSLTSSQQSFKCQKCDEKFRYKAMLDRHMWTHKSDNPDHICTKDKVKCHMEQLLNCNYCDKVYPCNLMNRHVRQIHFHESFSCVVCEIYDMTPDIYSKHVFDRHSGDGNGDKNRNCLKCKEIHEIYKHGKGIEYFCDYCILVRPSKKRNSESTIHDCHLCKARFISTEVLNMHMSVHRAPKFICNYCHKIFVNSELYKKHVKNHYAQCGRKRRNFERDTKLLKEKNAKTCHGVCGAC